MKDCRDCVHYEPDKKWLARKKPEYAHKYSKCKRTPQAFEGSYSYCSTERELDWECGVDAKHFKPTESYVRENHLTDEFLHDEFAFWFAPDRWSQGDNLRDPKTVAFWMK